MKQNLSKLIAGLVLGLALSAWLGATCNSANQATFRTIATERVTVQTAMSGWNAYVGQYHPSTNTELKVMAAYNKWRAAQMLVCDAGAVLAAWNQTNSSGSMGASAALEQAIGNEEQERTDLLTLLTALGVKF